MKILLVNTCTYPEARAGSEVYTHELSRALARDDRVSIFAGTKGGECRREVQEGIEYFLVPLDREPRGFGYRYRILRSGYYARVFADYVLREKPDIVHFQAMYGLGVSLVEICRRLAVPCVVTVHDHWWICPFYFSRVHYDRRLCGSSGFPRCLACLGRRWDGALDKGAAVRNCAYLLFRKRYLMPALNSSRWIVFPSRYLAGRYAAEGVCRGKIRVVPNGIDTSLYSGMPSRMSAGALHIGFLSGTNEVKGYALLLDALKPLRGERFVLDVWGECAEGAQESAREALAPAQVRFHGVYGREELPRVFAEMDVLAFPSLLKENCPLTILEALAAKVPVVAVDAGGVPELVRNGENGLLFRYNDACSLRDALGRILGQPGLLGRFRESMRPVRDMRAHAAELRGLYAAAVPARSWNNREAKVGVVVATLNGRELLAACLEAVYRQEYGNFFVVVVDNGSADGSADFVRSAFPAAEVISLRRNHGFAGANNIGIRRALARGAEYVCLLNNDARPFPGWLAGLVEAGRTDTAIGACQSKIVSMADASILDCAGIHIDAMGAAGQDGFGEKDTGEFNEQREIFGGCAASLLLKKEMLADIGLFDEDFFACFEDVDLALRSRRRGWKCLYVPASVAVHAHSATLGRNAARKEFLLARNRYLYLFKHFPLPVVWRVFRGYMRVFLRAPGARLAAAHIAAAALAPKMIWKRLRLNRRSLPLSRIGGQWLPAVRLPSGITADISLCIVSWNTRELLSRCLASLRAFSGGLRTEIIVVDNGSSDGSAEMVARDFPEATLIRNGSNRGFTAATNQAIRASRGRYVFLLNSDIEVTAGGLERLKGMMERDQRIAVLSCALTHPDGSLQHFCYRFPTVMTSFFEKTFLQRLFPGNRFLKRYYMKDWAHDSFGEVDQPPGCCLLFRREVLEATGLLDENMFLFFSDVDICLRVRKAGFRIFFTPDVRFGHGLGSSVRKLANADFHWFSDKIYYYRKHYGSPATAVITLVLALDFLLRSAELLWYGHARDAKKYLRLLARVACA